MKVSEILQISQPTVPMWAVYYDDGEDGIFLTPIVTLALIKRSISSKDEEGEISIEPMEFDRYNGVSQDYETPKKASNFLGFTLKEDDNRENWTHEIEGYLKGKEKRISETKH